MKTSAALLSALSEESRARFDEERSLLSFEDYLELVSEQPRLHSRDAARYLREMFDHFGVSELSKPYGELRRFHLFDDPLPSGERGAEAVAGQEEAQAHIYELLCDFERSGRAQRLILLHGPNGSAKSSLIRCMAKGLERYSATPEGALYTFSWVFPSKRRDGSAGIGFGSPSRQSEREGLSTYAYLSGSDLEARVPCETRDHPLLLLPREARVAWLKEQLEAQKDPQEGAHADVTLPLSLLEGELSPKSAQIYEALLKSYQGDVREVLKHVQVERFSASRRYRQAIATVDPQLRVDAYARQVTADRSLSALPQALQHLNLFEAGGHLVEGNRGLIEYNDLLKRPLEAFKYLLSTCESGAVRLDQLTLYLDALLIGSCNFEHLEAFKESQEFASFQGRLELIEVPYLRDVEQERKIYAPHLKALSAELELAPDLDWTLAMWGVMTRLERPQPVHYDASLKELIEGLTPLEKAELYSAGTPPERLSHEEGRALKQVVGELYREPQLAPLYEGLLGASPRELKALLLSLAHGAHAEHKRALARGAQPERPHLTSLSLLKALRALCDQTDLYPFLKRKPSGAYYQPKVFLNQLEELLLARFEERVAQALGLVEEVSVYEVFERYLSHLSASVKGERLLNELTGEREPPSEALMREVEERLKRAHTPSARAELIQRVGGWRLDHPDEPLNHAELFASELKALRASYLGERSERLRERLAKVCALIEREGARGAGEPLSASEEADALALLQALHEGGYPQRCASQMLCELYRQRSKV